MSAPLPDCFELSFELGALDPALAEQACLASGAIAVTYSDAAGQPVYEPRPGELRLWHSTRVQALFHAAQADAALILALAARLGRAPGQLAARAVANRAWEREWLRDFHAMRFGERLWICPRHEQVDVPDAVVVRLDPGLAFGTGSHASTALCLQWLDQAAQQAGPAFAGFDIIDYGCGSGVLAVAALRLGARRAYAFDIDPQALLATRQNAEANGVATRLQVCERPELLPRECRILTANILAPVLIALDERFATLLTRGAALLLAGILLEQEMDVAAAFRKWFDMSRFAQRDGWVALCGTRH
jgi:ribosomal protein L11 methyltransferase